ncbi:MAG: hypothetical protein ACFFCW_43780 [Candidatus Hodarchaeota archaeon]
MRSVKPQKLLQLAKLASVIFVYNVRRLKMVSVHYALDRYVTYAKSIWQHGHAIYVEILYVEVVVSKKEKQLSVTAVKKHKVR